MTSAVTSSTGDTRPANAAPRPGTCGPSTPRRAAGDAPHNLNVRIIIHLIYVFGNNKEIKKNSAEEVKLRNFERFLSTEYENKILPY